jgi:hypothetical protein
MILASAESTSKSMAASGSPGTRRSMKNTRVATAHMTTIAPKVRLKRYLLIGSP